VRARKLPTALIHRDIILQNLRHMNGSSMHIQSNYQIWRYHACRYEGERLMGSDAVLSGRSLYWRKVLLPLWMEGGGSTIPRNIGTVPTVDTASYQQKIIFIVILKVDSIVNVYVVSMAIWKLMLFECVISECEDYLIQGGWIQGFGGIAERRIPLGRHMCKCEDNIKIGLKM